MEHPIYKVLAFKNIGPYTLEVKFNDMKKKRIDFSSILIGELYKPLQNLKFFNRVRIDPEVHTLVWPNGADFDPASLHNWPRYVKSFSSAMKKWRRRKN